MAALPDAVIRLGGGEAYEAIAATWLFMLSIGCEQDVAALPDAVIRLDGRESCLAITARCTLLGGRESYVATTATWQFILLDRTENFMWQRLPDAVVLLGGARVPCGATLQSVLPYAEAPPDAILSRS